MPDLDKLQHHVTNLQSLLNDRHQGLSTWTGLIQHHWRAIVNMWDDGELWSEDWPTEPGHYWFSGRTHGYWATDKPKMHFVEVRTTVTVPLYFTDKGFFDEDDGADGYWMPARVPEPPLREVMRP